ncbi:hypothetical protein HPP92_021816 [Vanilla planifolia]|uniref:Uncharacterized protein n=1 Tax=Vanilla planifolia TaxID=51239 RepID=A0A835PX08_VANPL|nr:hypothetical protein HPP92_021816 [Vanilla planifolia]
MQANQETLFFLPTTSNFNLAAKNERDEAQKIATLVFDACAVVPDTPDKICDEQLKERSKNSHENGGSEMENEGDPAEGLKLQCENNGFLNVS